MMTMTRTKTAKILVLTVTWEGLVQAMTEEVAAGGRTGQTKTKAQTFGKVAEMALDKSWGVVASGQALTVMAGVARGVVGEVGNLGEDLVQLAEDRDCIPRIKMRNKAALVQGKVAGARIGVVQTDPLVRGAEVGEALVRVVLAVMTNHPGRTPQETLARRTVMEETLVSQDGAEAGAGVGVEEARMAQVDLSGSRDLQVKWIASLERVAEVAEAGEGRAPVAGATMTQIRWIVALEGGRGMVESPAGGVGEDQTLPGEAGVDLTVAEVEGEGAALGNKAWMALTPKIGVNVAATPKAGAKEVVAEETMIGMIPIVARKTSAAGGAVKTGTNLETCCQVGAEAEVGLGKDSNKMTSGSLRMSKGTTHHGGRQVTG